MSGDEPAHSAGEKMQAAGKAMESCGASIMLIGCSGFILFVIVILAIALLSK
jgi:hypothetical protein